MEISRLSCSLEEMMSFIAKKNHIDSLQLVFYRRVGYECEEERRWLGLDSDKIKAIIRGEIKLESSLVKDAEKTDDENMGIISLVRSRGVMCHIPMIDFDCSLSGDNLLRVAETLTILGQEKGFVLESGQSYHYYGIELLDAEKWIEFMKKCKTQELIGEKWPMFQLKRGYSTLRISVSIQKPRLPRIIAKIGNFEFKI